MHIAGSIPLPLGMALSGGLVLLLFSTNDVVRFGDLISYAVILLRGRFPRFVVLDMMSAHPVYVTCTVTGKHGIRHSRVVAR